MKHQASDILLMKQNILDNRSEEELMNTDYLVSVTIASIFCDIYIHQYIRYFWLPTPQPYSSFKIVTDSWLFQGTVCSPKIPCFSSSSQLLLLFSHPIMSDSLKLHGLQHTSPPIPYHLPEFAQVHVLIARGGQLHASRSYWVILRLFNNKKQTKQMARFIFLLKFCISCCLASGHDGHQPFWA